MPDFKVLFSDLLVLLAVAAAVQIRVWVEDWLARQRLETALGRAVGLVLSDTRFNSVDAGLQRAAIAAGREYIRSAIPSTLRKLGVDDKRLEDMIRAEIAKAS